MTQIPLIDSSPLQVPQPKFKPLLAYTVQNTSELTYPLYASIKLDGIRVVILNGIVYSRSMKPIRSRVVQSLFGKLEYNGLDGEILYGSWNAENVFNMTTQAVMSFDLKPGFDKSQLKLAVFDYIGEDFQYTDRLITASKIVRKNDYFQNYPISILPQALIQNESELLEFEEIALDQGYEGVMVRSIGGRYKQGRSTKNEGIIGKLKRFTDAEAKVIGFEERMHNTNESKLNELGHSQRSQSKEGMVGTGTLGALVCTCDGIEFTVGSGFNDSQRAEVWNNQTDYLGRLAKFKYFKVGMKDSFRFPIFLGWRDQDDMEVD